MLKKITLSILHSIRKILTIFRNHCLPIKSPSLNSISYEMYKKEEIEKSYNYFKKYFPKSVFVLNQYFQEFIINKAKENDPMNNKFYLEFGVWKGHSINFFSKYTNKIYGFDSFEGLREDWFGTLAPKGTFNLYKKLPKVRNNVILIKGWVQDTLDLFLDKHKPEINFVHLDLDTYESTKFTLEKIKPYLTKKSIITFDQLYNYPGWEMGEYKALKEIFNENEYEYIAFCSNNEQVAIRII